MDNWPNLPKASTLAAHAARGLGLSLLEERVTNNGCCTELAPALNVPTVAVRTAICPSEGAQLVAETERDLGTGVADRDGRARLDHVEAAPEPLEKTPWRVGRPVGRSPDWLKGLEIAPAWDAFTLSFRFSITKSTFSCFSLDNLASTSWRRLWFSCRSCMTRWNLSTITSGWMGTPLQDITWFTPPTPLLSRLRASKKSQSSLASVSLIFLWLP